MNPDCGKIWLDSQCYEKQGRTEKHRPKEAEETWKLNAVWCFGLVPETERGYGEIQ